ncbi:hypothetical protein A3E46_02865 [Candidatus Woesebacteria bacterium RIFCSPHIGHO2_12_FULL_46_16]|uniref:Uncharacterized protein n=1 Tax=Candidatus Woesebacteria bacterium RIFCSPHIGHO2_12_FULL_46_16 TaxID=1802513 RepID=A0A1F8AWC8_9BACT|nr:MAG: hypothetical protein A3E46_02865 [Candidatus Woesebacteria bacterium RIFCSPHIGHO2_12_FULL_46_16]
MPESDRLINALTAYDLAMSRLSTDEREKVELLTEKMEEMRRSRGLPLSEETWQILYPEVAISIPGSHAAYQKAVNLVDFEVGRQNLVDGILH